MDSLVPHRQRKFATEKVFLFYMGAVFHLVLRHLRYTVCYVPVDHRIRPPQRRDGHYERRYAQPFQIKMSTQFFQPFTSLCSSIFSYSTTNQTV
jgi:hypothetical protein